MLIALLPEIKSTYWAMKVGEVGAIATDAADINQCIGIILSTSKGTVPHLPNFGSDIFNYLDYPIDRARPHIIREAIAAIQLWEPRIDLIRVSILDGDIGQLIVRSQWKLKNNGIIRTTEVVISG